LGHSFTVTTNNAPDGNGTVSIGFHYAAVNVTPDVIVMAPGSGTKTVNQPLL
jgi:hypothetical protein